MFSLNNSSEGFNDETPIVLEGYKADDFESLLEVLIPRYGPYLSMIFHPLKVSQPFGNIAAQSFEGEMDWNSEAFYSVANGRGWSVSASNNFPRCPLNNFPKRFETPLFKSFQR
jgi:hypothetical protein